MEKSGEQEPLEDKKIELPTSQCGVRCWCQDACGRTVAKCIELHNESVEEVKKGIESGGVEDPELISVINASYEDIKRMQEGICQYCFIYQQEEASKREALERDQTEKIARETIIHLCKGQVMLWDANDDDQARGRSKVYQHPKRKDIKVRIDKEGSAGGGLSIHAQIQGFNSRITVDLARCIVYVQPEGGEKPDKLLSTISAERDRLLLAMFVFGKIYDIIESNPDIKSNVAKDAIVFVDLKVYLKNPEELN